MIVQLPAGLEVDVDNETVALRVNGRAVLQLVEWETAELAIALGAAARVLEDRRRDAAAPLALAAPAA